MIGKKRKGMSADDKRMTILSIYHDKKDPLNLKEIENFAAKSGVVQQTVKEHNQSLVDDGIVLSDKIGSSNFFWSFPSKTSRDRLLQKESILCKIDNQHKTITTLKEKIQEARCLRIGVDRKLKMQTLTNLIHNDKQLTEALENEKVNDPEEIKRVQCQVAVCKSAADRWTDNIWALKGYLTKKKGMAGKEVDRMLFIDGSFDYFIFNELVQPHGKPAKKKIIA